MKKTIKAWVVCREGLFMAGWFIQTPFTGALSIFESREKAKNAIAYNRALEISSKLSKGNRKKYKIIEVKITLKSNAPSN